MEQALMVSSGPQPMDAFAKTRVRGFPLAHAAIRWMSFSVDGVTDKDQPLRQFRCAN